MDFSILVIAPIVGAISCLIFHGCKLMIAKKNNHQLDDSHGSVDQQISDAIKKSQIQADIDAIFATSKQDPSGDGNNVVKPIPPDGRVVKILPRYKNAFLSNCNNSNFWVTPPYANEDPIRKYLNNASRKTHKPKREDFLFLKDSKIVQFLPHPESKEFDRCYNNLKLHYLLNDWNISLGYLCGRFNLDHETPPCPICNYVNNLWKLIEIKEQTGYVTYSGQIESLRTKVCSLKAMNRYYFNVVELGDNGDCTPQLISVRIQLFEKIKELSKNPDFFDSPIRLVKREKHGFPNFDAYFEESPTIHPVNYHELVQNSWDLSCLAKHWKVDVAKLENLLKRNDHLYNPENSTCVDCLDARLTSGSALKYCEKHSAWHYATGNYNDYLKLTKYTNQWFDKYHS